MKTTYQKSTFLYASPLGTLEIEAEEGLPEGSSPGICALRFLPEEHRTMREPPFPTGQNLLRQACQELEEYFAGKRKVFSVPLSVHGTEFQERVWKELQKIPYGTTCSYGQLAAAIGKPKACRAVGMANNRNPLPIFIPCHRVIGSNGKLVGYGGGLDIKEKLLKLEQEK
ncbi:MAG: methylated-DNA--[protein]-cysteine S-methyltransferase [Lachnospiraceae bacterium]|nr:methylated-DNA--[protein]-cysteine S-methyltransferase [Lachnospiraceae bacterium]